MKSMSLAETTVLFGFHSVRVILLFFGHVVVTLFALRTCQCDLYAHDFHLRLFFACWTASIRMPAYLICRFLGIKKKPTSIRPDIISRRTSVCQAFSLENRQEYHLINPIFYSQIKHLPFFRQNVKL